MKAVLSKDLRDCLVTVKLPSTFQRYCDEVRQIADNMQEIEEINRRATRFSGQVPKATDQRRDAIE